MSTKLTFLGAAGNVTGSRYLLESGGARLLVDCGLYSERPLKIRNWEPFPVPPDSLDAILITHAHIDHSGFLPKLVHDGFHGKIYCTTATAEIIPIMLLDAAHIQEEDAAFKQKRHQKEGRQGPHPEIPLYTVADAEATLPLLVPVPYGQPVRLAGGVTATFRDAGHVLGSSMIKLTIGPGADSPTIVFSGDVGRWNSPILRDPTIFGEVDYVLVESTYGDRLHEGAATIEDELAAVVNDTVKKGGNIIVPSFALERAQEVLYHLNKLLREDRIPHLLVFLDSPMAVRLTGIFKNHPELFDRDMAELIRRNLSPFEFTGLKLVQTVDESKAINRIKGSVMIIAGAGMCTGGRIKHHLITNITRRESTILFVGYQASGTLGRLIVDGAKKVRILGQHYPVKARIVQIHGFSAHADRDDLFRWLSGLKKAPRQVFVVHGEPESSRAFADFLEKKTGWRISVPQYGEQVTLD